MIGGRDEIRTHDTVTRIHTFQACAFNHSATLPHSPQAWGVEDRRSPILTLAFGKLGTFNHSATTPHTPLGALEESYCANWRGWQEGRAGFCRFIECEAMFTPV